MRLGKMIDPRFHAALQKLSAEPLSLKVAFKLKGIVKTAQDEFVKYDEVRQAALLKYGIKNDDGSLKLDDQQRVQFSDENKNLFVKELEELTAIDIPLATLKLSELNDNVKLTLGELELLDEVIVEE